MTRPGDWRPVATRGRSAGAAAADPATSDGEQVPAERSTNGHPSAATCIFCDRPSGDVTYAWPDWLCQAIADHQDRDHVERPEPDIDLVSVERAEIEADKTTVRLCETCRQGWIQRLDDNVSPFLTSMIDGAATPLPSARRKLLARWAAKTAIVLEYAGETSLPTPRFAREHLRSTGVHPGTQVLVGRYEGRQIFSAERDVSVGFASHEPRHLSRTSLVMGNLLIQVFADPWADAPPELTDQAMQPFIALIGHQGPGVEWPPDLAIDDAFGLVPVGAELGGRSRQAPSNVALGREATMPTNGGTRPPTIAAGDRDAGGWNPTSPAPVGVVMLDPADRPAETTAVQFRGGPPPEMVDTARRGRPRRRVAVAALALVAVVGLGGFAFHERSNAQQSSARAVTSQRRAQALVAQLRLNAQQLSANEATITRLQNRVAALEARTTRSPNQSAVLRQILAAVPAATDGVRQCANAAFDAASSALDFAAAYPQSAAHVDAAATNAASVCSRAGQAANALDQLADRASR